MSPTLGAGEIRELAQRLDLRPSKSLGQNFVVDGNTCRKIVRLAKVDSSDVVLEIGPGLGSLTLVLLAEAKALVAIEIDNRLAKQLPLTIAAHLPERSSDLDVIDDDALNVTHVNPEPTALVANLPYNISVPVLLHVLENFTSINRGIVMVQAEVAQRLAAKSGSKIYGVPSVKLAWWADAEIASSISQEVFWPVPRVDSLLLSFTRRTSPEANNKILRDRTFSVIDAAFAQRRKMLRASLTSFLGSSEQAGAKLTEWGIDPTARAENLTLNDFIVIARGIFD
ncbi:MAG: 16S rRNA (adenine(1518)-N(6)/adenine(1519)-N(6))-dimethyltransferase RsmA [Actinobacteria bacterium]|uniref:Ribosomal RNA small subunit methyltransferase A n=1 Tax=Candidatus Fonsibacter lacus TaxID=2576439 RepID=A0A965LKZ0_9PROT|nr:16S rRNA (adenine(1518)-N(6)/adenine(1519)-N(6))-dimethyltransferase RsmA [Candidatus Fonsibacter lacus]